MQQQSISAHSARSKWGTLTRQELDVESLRPSVMRNGHRFGTMSQVSFPALALVFFFAAGPIFAQCPGRQLPAGSVLVTQNSGTFTAPGNGKFDYSQFPIDLTQFPSGGILTIAATLGKGQSKASFSLWLAETAMMPQGIPSASLTLSAYPGIGDQVPGSCVTPQRQ